MANGDTSVLSRARLRKADVIKDRELGRIVQPGECRGPRGGGCRGGQLEHVLANSALNLEHGTLQHALNLHYSSTM
jgi:hypothetical protein